jgi:hypothetical protein
MTTLALIKKNSTFLLLVFLVYAFLDWAITAYFDGLSEDPSDPFDPYSMLGLIAVIVLEVFLFFVVVNRLSRSSGDPVAISLRNVFRSIAVFFAQFSMAFAPFLFAMFIISTSMYPDFHVSLGDSKSVLYSELTKEQMEKLSDDQFISSLEKRDEREGALEILTLTSVAASVVIFVFVLVVFALAPYFAYLKGVGVVKSFSSSYWVMTRRGGGYLILILGMIVVEAYFSSLSALANFDLYDEVYSYWVLAAFMLLSFVMLFKIFHAAAADGHP